MRIGNQVIELFVDTLLNNPDALLGLSVLNGRCQKYGGPAVAVQLGLFFITFTVTISEYRRLF
jgi:hypothetical protein